MRVFSGFLPPRILSNLTCDEEGRCCCVPLSTHPFEMVIAAAVVELTAAHQRITLFWQSVALIYPLILLSEKVNWGQSARGAENGGKTLPT